MFQVRYLASDAESDVCGKSPIEKTQTVDQCELEYVGGEHRPDADSDNGHSSCNTVRLCGASDSAWGSADCCGNW